jgi:hypothetical protein
MKKELTVRTWYKSNGNGVKAKERFMNHSNPPSIHPAFDVQFLHARRTLIDIRKQGLSSFVLEVSKNRHFGQFSDIYPTFSTKSAKKVPNERTSKEEGKSNRNSIDCDPKMAQNLAQKVRGAGS